MTMTARTRVPDEGELRLGSVRLPAGRLLRDEDGTGEPTAWITETAVPEPEPVRTTAAKIAGAPVWYFWWD